MSLEHDLLSRMFEDDLTMARGLMAIKDYHMAAMTLDRAIEKIHQIASVDGIAPAHLVAPKPISVSIPASQLGTPETLELMLGSDSVEIIPD